MILTVYGLKINNYKNRIVKKYNTVSDYLTNSIPGTYTVAKGSVAFNEGDQLNTTQVLETDEQLDYLITTFDGTTVYSRWFVVGSQYNRQNIRTFILKRDVIADNINTLLDADIYIERGYLSDYDPYIFNKEGLQFNQIKTWEKELKDESGCPWIVGYLAKNASTWDDATSSDKPIEISTTSGADYFLSSLSNYTYYSYRNGECKLTPDDYKFASFFKCYNPSPLAQGVNIRLGMARIDFNKNGDSIDNGWAFDDYGVEPGNMRYEISSGYKWGFVNSTQSSWYPGTFSNPSATTTSTRLSIPSKETILGKFRTNLSSMISLYGMSKNFKDATTFNNILNENGKVIRVMTGADAGLWKVNVRRRHRTVSEYISTSVTSFLKSVVWNTLISEYPTYFDTPSSSSWTLDPRNMRVEYEEDYLEMTIEQFEGATATVSIPEPGSRMRTNEYAFDMFCIPYSDTIRHFSNNVHLCTANKEIALATAGAISAWGSKSGNVLDIQLLPYCPIRNYIVDNTKINIGIDTNVVTFVKQVSDSRNICPVYFCKSATGTFDISVSGVTVREPKIENECDMYRLCSPNFATQFEFNVARNRGLSKFNVDYAYKPYSPYIHINPNFSGLYGVDFNDARGLILGGDFSLTQLNDEWSTYQLQNVNYERSFQRNIDTFERDSNLMLWNNIANGTVSSIGAGIGVAKITDSLNYGHAAGLLSAGSGITDTIVNQISRNDELDRMRTQEEYRLGNIQALPVTISKVSSYNPNNKLFPILEYYTCTETEKESFRKYIEFNSMKVGRIDKIRTFLTSELHFIKGTIIRNLDTIADSNVLNEINTELEKGVYIDDNV